MKYQREQSRISKFSHCDVNKRGMTLVEVMVAVAFVIVAALGTLCYEYLCVDHVRIARAELIATRLGQLLIEDWKSTGGASDYNPEDLNMGFDLPDGLMTNCVTVVDGLPLHISMTHSDVDGGVDTFSGTKLSELNVEVSWKKNFGTGAIEDDDPRVTLATYVRQDQ
jgi:Tfp pilus assembly protein PilV